MVPEPVRSEPANPASLSLEGVGRDVAGAVHLHPVDLAFVPGSFNVLLGATRAGKTTLMRLIAGLEPPSRGRILDRGRDVTGVSVRHRDLAMVYQQFINYPSLTVRENIASPLRLQRRPAAEIRARVEEIAGALHLTPFLERRPGELSGGQQQRTALARALAKDAALLLLDEPLGNLDYKLREELRAELVQLLADRRTTVVYATTEPQEALQFGGQVAVLVEGRLLQSGPTLEVFARPTSLAAAQAFSDPPLNVLPAVFDAEHGDAQVAGAARLSLAPRIAARLRAAGIRELLLGVRPHQFALLPDAARPHALDGIVELAEISGSDTYLHVVCAGRSLVAQLPGVHVFALGSPVRLYLDPRGFLGFTLAGERLFAAGEG
jgi:glycerol transport system ATP-binding protein